METAGSTKTSVHIYVFTVTAVRTSNRTQISYSYYFLHNNQT